MLEYWFMFPIGVLFATIAMAVGIGGAAMFTPFFLLVLRIPANIAVGVGLFIEVFGFGSGLLGFARKKLIEYKVGIFILCFTIPAAMIGAFVANSIPEVWIKLTLAGLLLILAIRIIEPDKTVTLKCHQKQEPCTHDEEQDCYRTPENKIMVGLLTAIGGLLGGMVSTGIGEMNDFALLKKYEMHGPIAAGTSVFVVALTVLVGSASHAYAFFTQSLNQLEQVFNILIFTIPGVLLGGQLGVKVSELIPEEKREIVVGSLFVILAVVTILSLFL